MTDANDAPHDPGVCGDRSAPEAAGDPGPTASGLLTTGGTLLRANPRVLLVMLLAGVAVAVVDWVRLADPVPVTAFVGLASGRVSVNYQVVPGVTAGTSLAASARAGLRPIWIAWVVGLELVRTLAVAFAGAYGFARVFNVDLTPAAIARYAVVVGGLATVGAVTPEITGPLVAIWPLIVAFLYIVVHLFALPALLVDGATIRVAISRSWGLTAGHGWSLAGVVVALGLAAHVLVSLPLVDPIGAVALVPLGGSLVAALQIGVVAAFVRHVESDTNFD